ncbi:MAG: hypothetical protein KC646_05595 [Candidatus Cloacimonetes bacterium]|nr:hypothetical protein [Candidatus Cloacimonadota bacterium]
MPQLLISNDVQLAPEKKQELLKLIEHKFFNYKIQEISIKNLSWKKYRNVTKNCDTIVILFAGYNLKRYWNNLLKHLIGSNKTLYGVNIEGHFFSIPKLKTLNILIYHKLKTLSLSFISKWL